MWMKNLLVFLSIALIFVDIYASMLPTLSRIKRIARRKKKAKLDKWGSTIPPTGTSIEDDFAQYPEGYFVKPGQTDRPEQYDYVERKFNKPHLIKPEWKDKYTKQERKHEINGPSRLKSIAPIAPIVPVGVFDDSLLR